MNPSNASLNDFMKSIPYPGPEQMELEFEDTIELYARGMDSGLFWDVNWVPGGPLVYDGRNEQLRRESKRECEAWKRGFREGLAIRLLDTDFAAWWNAHRGLPAARYSPTQE